MSGIIPRPVLGYKYAQVITLPKDIRRGVTQFLKLKNDHMGSGDKRSPKDTVIIKRPKKAVLDLPLGVSSSKADIAAGVCIPSFEVKLKPSPHIKAKAPVRLVRSGGIYLIMLSMTEVGRLTAARTAIIDNCASLGIHYSGTVILKKDGVYAVFTRNL
jgi:hypothetical protein